MPLSSTTQLANLALAKIGARRIGNIETENTEEARHCRDFFFPTLERVLRSHQWSFATHRARLSAVLDAPFSEWETAWQLPGDLVRHIAITGRDPHNPLRDYAIEGRLLLLNYASTETVTIRYVRNSVPIGHWDALFVDAITLALAAELAGPIAQSPDQRQALLAEYTRLALPNAELVDSRETTSGENFGAANLASMSGLVAARFRRGARPPYIPLP